MPPAYLFSTNIGCIRRLIFLSIGIESIAPPPDSNKVAWFVLLPELLAQPAHMNVYGAGRGNRIIAPYLVEEFEPIDLLSGFRHYNSDYFSTV
jgi:hypothetical protein